VVIIVIVLTIIPGPDGVVGGFVGVDGEGFVGLELGGFGVVIAPISTVVPVGKGKGLTLPVIVVLLAT
jgi:hypothetical protein